MSAAHALDALFARLAKLDVRLALDGERLGVNAPKGALTAELRAELATHKEAIKQALRERAQAPRRAPTADLVRVAREARMPVAHTQQRLWFLRQMDPASSAYNVVSAFQIHGPLDVAALERSLDDLVRRHESLRTRFFAIEGVPWCRIDEDVRAGLELVDLAAMPAAARKEEAIRRILLSAGQAFDLARGPLLRLTLVRLEPQWHMFGFVVDHIVADGMSVGIFFHEMQALYGQHSGGAAADLPPLSVQYIDHVHWQRQVLAGGAAEEHLAYWKQQLRGLPPILSLPTDRARPRLQSYRGARRLELMPPALAAELKALARSEGVTLYMVLLAGLEVLLNRYSGEEDFAVGTAVGARNQPELERVVGFFANNIVQRANLSGDPSGRELLARVREVALKAYAHQDMPFDLLVEVLAPRRDLDHSPLFQVLFVLHNLMTASGRLGDATCTVQELPLTTSRFDLAVDIFDVPEGMRVYFEYNSDLFDEATIVRMMAHYRSLLAGLVADPAARVGSLPMLAESEQRSLLGQWRGACLPPAQAATVHGLFEAQVRRTPAAQAIVFEGCSLSFAELDARANRVAHRLLGMGVRPQALVGVWMERSPDMVVALLAVLKAGAAYVPLDPAFPQDRIDFMMADAALEVVLTQSSLAARLVDTGPRALALDADAGLIADEPATAPDRRGGGEDLAYVIYTSGSTGLPKGVQIEHRALVNFLRSMHIAPGIHAEDRFVSVTTLSFDIAGLEIFGPLTVGGTVVLASRATALDGPRLAALLDEQRASILQATPATWRLLLDSGWKGRAGLKMLCGGESLQRELAERLLALDGELWNMYGPTETTIWSTLCRVHDAARPISIGRPIAETTIYVLEPSGLPAPPGVAGELCIGGAGVARGYRNRPELTAEKFLTVAVGGQPPERIYRTGDLARWRSDGELEFIGRRDHQVKLRGLRIELEEIENVLATHPGVRQCVVAVREDRPGDQRLVAYVVAAAGMPFEAGAARSTLRAKLPEYMVPNLLVTLDSLPLTPNGKVDRKALPAPQTAAAASADDGSAALMNPIQQRVAAAWRDLLGTPRVGLTDNFFDLGGHSLLLVRLQVRLQREFATELPLIELFQRTTVASQAERLGAGATDNGALQRARARAEKQAHV